MNHHRHYLRLASIALFALLMIGFGIYAHGAGMIAGGIAGMCYAGCMAMRKRCGPASEAAEGSSDLVSADVGVAQVGTPTPADTMSADPSDIGELVQQMLAQSRYAILLRKQVVGHLTPENFRRTTDALQRTMALVPEGGVVLAAGGHGESPDDGDDPAVGDGPASGRLVQVAAFFLDRYPVTNGEYQAFVAGGGYREIALWDAKVWPAVLDMVDETGLPGPRFWKSGRPLPGEENLPVVGVSWYEAAAFARWVGKRLPTDAEWVKAACWPVAMNDHAMAYRRYPWGETMDRSRANVWGSGPNRVVGVDEFAGGVSVGGVYQLIGNVWEWTGGSFRGNLEDDAKSAAPMKSIRGGAFDTYFDTQATCQFGSGEYPLSRRHNVGFRCAINVCDLVLTPRREIQDDAAECPVGEPEEACV